MARNPSAAAKKLVPISPEAEEPACREPGCESLATTRHYCRSHYIKNWVSIKEKEELLKDGRFRRFIEDLASQYPESILQAIRHDLSSDDEFEKVCQGLGLQQRLGDLVAIDTDAIDAAAAVFSSVQPEEKEGEESE